jgi:hypothetical protein
MKLITKAIENKLKKFPLYSTDGVKEKKTIVKFFNPCGVGTWLVYEGNKLENGDWEFFGNVDLGYGFELGYFLLSDLESIRLPFGLKIERDLYYHD